MSSAAEPQAVTEVAAVPQIELLLVPRQVTSPRTRRRFVKRISVRTVRPRDSEERTTTPWYRRPKVIKPITDRPRLLERAHQREMLPDADSDDDAEIVARVEPTTEADFPEGEGDIIVEKSHVDDATIAVVVMPFPALPSVEAEKVEDEFDDLGEDEPDGFDATIELIGDTAGSEEVLELPFGCHVEDGGGYFSRQAHLEQLARAAQIEPDWGDPEQWDFGRTEPTYLIVRA